MKLRLAWVLVGVIGLVSVTACGSGTLGAGGSIEGFVDSGGVNLRYLIDLPEGDAPFKTVVFGPGSGNAVIDNKIHVAHTKNLLKLGFAVVRYDKRGIGESEGELLSLSTDNSFSVVPQLAADMKAVLEASKTHSEVDADRVSLWGVSQAAWYLPVVASEVPNLEFMVVVSGGLVPVGPQNHWEFLTRIEELDPDSPDTISAARNYAGPVGFDQRPLVRNLKIPSLYLAGEADRFVSFDLIREEHDRMEQSGADVSFISYEGGEHGLADTDFWDDFSEWLVLKGVGA